MTLQVKNLNHKLQGLQLLTDVNVSVTEAKLIGIIGPNGAGKSTLLKCLSGLIPTKGAIVKNQKAIESMSASEMACIRVALPQETNLNFPFIVKDIVGLSFALFSLSNIDQESITNTCLEIVSATEMAGRNFLTLSGGEKQRVQLARVFAQLMASKESNQMRFMYLDEPTAPLDMKYQFQIFNYLQDVVKKNITVITVVHDINLAAAYCNEIWVMQAGHLVKKDQPHKVISKNLMKSVFDVDIEIIHKDNHKLPIVSNPIQ